MEDTEKIVSAQQKELYLETWKLAGIVLVFYFIWNMKQPYMNLNHYGMGPKSTNAIATAQWVYASGKTRNLWRWSVDRVGGSRYTVSSLEPK
jgi:hypothetical protein